MGPQLLGIQNNPARPHRKQLPGGFWQKHIPFVSDFLASRRPVYCNVYRRGASGSFRVMLKAGEDIPPALVAGLVRHRNRKHYYVAADDRHDLVRYQEDNVDALLSRADVPLEGKCRLLHNLTAQLSQEIVEKPTALSAYRQQTNIARIVDFALAEPAAIQTLVQMTTQEYSITTHAVNVGFYSLLLTLRHFRWCPRHVLQETAFAYFIHDMGKIRVRPAVIEKPGPLSDDEWWEMRRHPLYGFNLLERAQIVTPQSRIVVLQHHERIDGKGYPDGLARDAVHPYARICAVADAFDSLTTDHAFRKGMGVFEAFNIMKDQTGTQFDTDLYRSFVLLWKAPFDQTQ